MTEKEIELLGVHDSPLNLDVTDQLAEVIFNPDKGYYVKIGRASFFDFSEAQILLNDLEKHINIAYED